MRLGSNVRKSAAVLAAVGMVSAVAACGSGSDSGSGSSATAGGAGSGSKPSWCGDKEITLALADGFGDNNWRRITAAEARDEANKCPSVKKFVYTDGQGNTQKAISDIRGLVAQGVNAMVVFPDAGKAVLPALRQAHQAGVVTVPYRVFPGGKAGQDYDYYISTDFSKAGELWGKWIVKALKGKGLIANLGGPPANSQSLAEYEGMKRIFAKYPGIKFVGQTPYNVTNWDPAQTQKVVTALLAKYPKIDAFTTDFGAALASSFGAFAQAGRKIPAVATEDSNQLSCDWMEKRKSNPDFQLFTVDSQNWMVRTAIQFAVAKASGGQVPASTEVPQKPFEDSIGKQPHPVTCDKSLPGDAFLSSHLSKSQIKAALGS
ncbi:MAG: substrate-binding domain-containing protein [Thermoleophilaceae bacterium]|nr:substrate-binding domain-containing protein [Thermoleophilaceae bacterium]